MTSSDIKTIGKDLRSIEDAPTRRLFESILRNIDVIKSSLATLEEKSSLEWFDVELQNGWVQYNSQYNLPQYAKNKDNIVFLRGLIKSGTITPRTALFTLPSGYRPKYRELFSIDISPTAHGTATLYTNGIMTANLVHATYTSLDGIIFQAYR